MQGSMLYEHGSSVIWFLGHGLLKMSEVASMSINTGCCTPEEQLSYLLENLNCHTNL